MATQNSFPLQTVVLQVGAGIQRDGTEFAAPSFRDGQWVRFQYGRPRKMGGYQAAFLNAPGISRGMTLQSQDGQTWVISGFSTGLNQWVIGNDQAIGQGPFPIYEIGTIATFANTTAGTGYINGSYSAITPTTTSGNGSGATFNVTVSGGAVTSVTLVSGGQGYGQGDTFTFSSASLGGNTTLASVAVTGTAGQFSCTATTLLVNQAVTVTGTLSGTATGISAGTYYITATNGTTTFTLSPNVGGTALATTAGTTTGLTFEAQRPVTAYVGTISTVYYYNTAITAPSSNYYINQANTLWQFDVGFDSSGSGQNNLIAHPGQNLKYIDSTINTRPLVGTFTGTAVAPVGVFQAVGTTTSGSNTVTFPITNIAMGAGVSVYGSGIPTGTTIISATTTAGVWTVTLSQAATASSPATYTLASVAVTGTAGQFSCTANISLATGQAVQVVGVNTGTATGITAGTYYIIATSGGGTAFTLSANPSGNAITTTAGTTIGLSFYVGTALTFDNNISVSGGVCMLYPYLFVYGNNGLIQNCSAGNFNNWTSSDSNANNISSTKVIKGLPIRGGTTSPAGLFWTLDSVIRVTYAPQTVGTATLYWRYDIITQQSSCLSSAGIIEYDGIFYWAGVDRFLMYNGVVQEIANTQNLNFFFDNLNLAQRQKVWCTKIPRWGEIIWFYPKGNSVECNDFIVYNVRESALQGKPVWYDSGQAGGAARSAGTFSEVFRRPIWAANTPNSNGSYNLWVHETGKDLVYLTQVDAIPSAIETNILGVQTGGVGFSGGPVTNLWTRLDRVEPDFQQVGTMNMIVTGKGFADDVDKKSNPYPFNAATLKIDLKEQRREMRLRFESNTIAGDYFMGRIVLNIDTGDVRGTGSP
jgi:hypothetical protein